jgi:hypothetical protein
LSDFLMPETSLVAIAFLYYSLLMIISMSMIR